MYYEGAVIQEDRDRSILFLKNSMTLAFKKRLGEEWAFVRLFGITGDNLLRFYRLIQLSYGVLWYHEIRTYYNTTSFRYCFQFHYELCHLIVLFYFTVFKRLIRNKTINSPYPGYKYWLYETSRKSQTILYLNFLCWILINSPSRVICA